MADGEELRCSYVKCGRTLNPSVPYTFKVKIIDGKVIQPFYCSLHCMMGCPFKNANEEPKPKTKTNSKRKTGGSDSKQKKKQKSNTESTQEVPNNDYDEKQEQETIVKQEPKDEAWYASVI